MIPSDRSLIRQYLKHDEQFAFDQLVCRHSEMVMKVCSNMLSQNADAEDAFQATFLVLARKVHTLRDRSSIAGWLYEVAIRNCMQVRQRRRRARETELSDDNAVREAGRKKQTDLKREPWQIVARSEEARVVLAEINQLPTKYREVIVLCCIDEHSRRTTANLLNQTEATVKGLLARGRNLLKNRLVKRRIAPTVALAVSQADSCLGAANEVHPSLMQATLRTLEASFQSESIDTKSFASSVASESLRQMAFAARAKLTAIAAVLLVLVAVPLAVLAQKPLPSREAAEPFASLQASETHQATKLSVDDETEQVAREVEQTKVTGSTFYERFRQITPAVFDSDEPSVIQTSLSGKVTDSSGKPVASALVVLRVLIRIDSDGEKQNGILAKTTTDATGSYSFENVARLRKHTMLEVVAAAEDGSLGWKNFSWKRASLEQDISLSKTIPVRGRIVNEKGVAVENASVTLALISPRRGNSPMSTGYHRRLSSPEAESNAEGYIEFPAMPKNVSLRFNVNHPAFAVQQFLELETFDATTDIEDFTLKAGAKFRGRIQDRDGNPVAGAEIRFSGRVFKTNDNGQFSFPYAEKLQGDGLVYFATQHPQFGASSQRVKGDELKAGTAVIELINLSKLAEIRGRVVAKDNGQPVTGIEIRGYNKQQPFNSVSTYLNDNGGYVLKGVSSGTWNLSLIGSAPGFDLRQEDCIHREVTLKAKETQEVDFSVPRIDPIEVRVLDQQGQPVIGAEVNAALRLGSHYQPLFRNDWPVTDMNGSASLVPDLKPDSSTVLTAKWKDKGQVYWAQRYLSTQTSANDLVLKPSATLQGKVAVNGEPIAGAKIRVGSRQNSILVTEGDKTTAMAATRYFDNVETDSNGIYSLQVPAANPLGNPPVYMLTLQSSGDIPNPDVRLRSESANFDGIKFTKDFDLFEGDGKVSGSVVNAVGTPVPGVTVSVFQLLSPDVKQQAHPTRLYLPNKTVTDKNGRFTIEGLPIGATVSLATKHSKTSDLKKFDKSAYRTTRQVVIGAETETTFVLQSITMQR